jgi:hypothetical protein
MEKLEHYKLRLDNSMRKLKRVIYDKIIPYKKLDLMYRSGQLTKSEFFKEQEKTLWAEFPFNGTLDIYCPDCGKYNGEQSINDFRKYNCSCGYTFKR